MDIKHAVRFAMMCSLLAVGENWAGQITICDDPKYRGTPEYKKYCSSSSSSDAGGYDDGGAAARSRAQAAEAARHAAEQRRQESELEQQRINADSKRRMEDIANQAKFIDDRNAAVSTLRGSAGASAAPTGAGAMLRGGGSETGLRGLRPNTVGDSNLDSMVVDARNVPTGLPKTIEEAIPNTPAGNRVRKGFQAIMEHDWTVARAWFQDALNYDPGNAGIRRLVSLAEYTLQRGKVPNSPASRGKPLANTEAEDAGKLALLDRQLDHVMDDDLQRSIDDFNRNYLPKHPELLKPEKRSQTVSPSAEQQATWTPFLDALFC